MTAYEQMLVMFIFICCGILIGCSLETFRHFGRFYRRNVFFVYISEVLFWLLQMAFLYYVLWQLNDGILRIYFILAVLVGWQLYHLFFKKIYLPFMRGVFYVCHLFFQVLYHMVRLIIYWPIYFIWKVLITVIRFIFLPIIVVFQWVLSLLPEKMHKNISQIGVRCSTILNKYIKN